MPTPFLSMIDPTLLSGVRDHLAATFAARIGDAIDEVSGFIEFESELIADAAERRALESAGRLLYANRAGIEARLARDIGTSFNATLDPAGARGRQRKLRADVLELVQDDQLAEDIAVMHCSNRLKEQSDYELFALTRRICLLVGRDHLADDANPVLPRVFVRALMQAIGSDDEGHTVKLAMFKAFGPLLLEIMPDTYSAASLWLSHRGIDADASIMRPVLTPERPFLHAPLQPAPAITPEQVSSLIQELQSALPPRADAAGTVTAAPADAADLPSLNAARAAAVADALITLLGTEPGIPRKLQPVIARLRGPLVWMAAREPAFFTQPAHPARKLLDLLAEYGAVLELEADDGRALDSVAKIVEAVVRNHEDDPLAFTYAWQRLDDLYYHHEETALQADAGIRALQEKELLACANDAASGAIAQSLGGKLVPAEIAAFIQLTWRKVLVRDFLDGGADGTPWALGVATMDELLKSVLPSTQREQRAGHARSLTSLIELVRDGIEHAQMNPLLADDFLTTLQAMHGRAVRGIATDHQHAVESPVPPVPPMANHVSPSQRLTEMGLACGSWLEIDDGGSPQRWRLCWVTPFHGNCVLKQYDHHLTRVMTLSELAAALSSRKARRVDGMGLIASLIRASIKLVDRRAQANAAGAAARIPATSPRATSQTASRLLL